MTFTRSLTLTTLAALTLPIMALAQVEDSDGDGAYSMEEMMVVYPDLTSETFSLIDTNVDGVIDDDELAAAVEAGVLAE